MGRLGEEGRKNLGKGSYTLSLAMHWIRVKLESALEIVH